LELNRFFGVAAGLVPAISANTRGRARLDASDDRDRR